MISTEKYTQKLTELSAGRQINLMEVCGTHTMAIAKAGIRSLLPENIRLLSGPGCPVCVTEQGDIDSILDFSSRENVILATYGDMMRVPGSVRGDCLSRRKALGAKVEVVYSPLDAVALAKKDPSQEVVFLGVGFETTAPGTAAAVRVAAEQGIMNFSLYSMLKAVEPALRCLIASPGFNVNGFLCPGHVATITGAASFDFLPREYGIPSVISGFEAEDILLSILKLVKQISSGTPVTENEYTRAVAQQGNTLAQQTMAEMLELKTGFWRGLGELDKSEYHLKEAYSAWDAAKKFSIRSECSAIPTKCRCGDVICGRLEPSGCPMFGKACTPGDPMGPCMVSSEGACAAYYKYRMV